MVAWLFKTHTPKIDWQQECEIIRQAGFRCDEIASYHRQDWLEDIKRHLLLVDWTAWRSYLEAIGFSVHLDGPFPFFPALKAYRLEGPIVCSVELALGVYRVDIKLKLGEVLKSLEGFRFSFEQGFSTRAVYGGGAYLEASHYAPAPRVPPKETIGSFLEENMTKAKRVIAL